jgi:hypothetical protein
MCADLLTKSANSSWLTLLRLPSPIIKPEMEFINICLKLDSFITLFCIFIFIFTIITVHTFIQSFIHNTI